MVLITALPVWSLGNDKGGPALHRTLCALAGRGYRVHLVSPHVPEQDLGSSITPHQVMMPKTDRQLLPLAGLVYRAAWAELFRRRALAVARRAGASDDIALVYGYEVQGVPPARDLANLYGCPLVTRFQGTIVAPWLHRFGWQLRFWPHLRALRCPADAVIMTNDGTQGEQVLRHLGSWGPQVRFWMNGVEKHAEVEPQRIAVLRKELGVGPHDPCLLTVSRLVSWKRVDRAITAMPRIIEQTPNCHLVIVGEGEARAALARQARETGLEHHVHFVGAVPREQLAAYYSVADVFLSLYDISNLGNPLLEAMSSHRCVVTLDVGDTRTIVRDDENGIMLTPHELSRLPDVIVELLGDPARRERLAAAAGRFAEQHFWTWEQRMEAEMVLIDQLVPARG